MPQRDPKPEPISLLNLFFGYPPSIMRKLAKIEVAIDATVQERDELREKVMVQELIIDELRLKVKELEAEMERNYYEDLERG